MAMPMSNNQAGKNILDLFGGSGSTLIACEKTNRKCFMSELDPHYVDVIVQRWMKYTGKIAYLIEDLSGKLKEPVPYVKIDSFQGENTQAVFKNIVQKNAGLFAEIIEIKNVISVKNIFQLQQKNSVLENVHLNSGQTKNIMRGLVKKHPIQQHTNGCLKTLRNKIPVLTVPDQNHEQNGQTSAVNIKEIGLIGWNFAQVAIDSLTETKALGSQ